MHQIAIREKQITRNQNLMEPVFYRSPELSLDRIIKTVIERAAERPHWVLGSGGEKAAKTVSRMHTHGHCGPLWEHLVSEKPEGTTL
jgi:hypothetical protein